MYIPNKKQYTSKEIPNRLQKKRIATLREFPELARPIVRENALITTKIISERIYGNPVWRHKKYDLSEEWLIFKDVYFKKDCEARLQSMQNDVLDIRVDDIKDWLYKHPNLELKYKLAL